MMLSNVLKKSFCFKEDIKKK